ncbi:HAMP domain-containing protein [Novosphingobium pokkalii]|uniref:HAMP domain-containing protein n=1 Tax=Novosphingobium pokkalii TaxID=1770194 RepID=UPI00363DC392
MALLVCALVAAQAVTLGLTVLFPPRPQARWSLDEVVQGLSGNGLSARLERAQLSGPPDIGGAGWLVAPATRDALAARLHRQSKDVMLAFYTQLPVGGIAVPAGRPGVAAQADRRALQAWPADWMVGTAHAQGAPPNGGFPGGGFPAGAPGGMPGGGGFPGVACLAVCPEAAGVACRGPRACGRIAQYAGQSHRGRRSITRIGHRRRRYAPTHCGRGSAARLAQRHARRFADPGAGAGRAVWRRGGLPVRKAAGAANPVPVAAATSAAPQALQPPRSGGNGSGPALPAAPAAARPPAAVAVAAPQPIPFRTGPQGGWLAMATPPFIEGDFIAAVRGADGRWTVVAPRAEAFPNRWQRQVALWFLLSLAIVSPLAWLFARRIVRPLEGFARAAETLGRDPAATILPLSGPAEIGRAAHAFNQMRNRLRAFVDDRTAMVGAISHDLRTPLTRLRFRLENVPDDQREGLLKEVIEMEAMISQVIAFIRDASTPGPRHVVDLGQLVAASVEDARLIGGAVTAEPAAPMAVEVDPVQIAACSTTCWKTWSNTGRAPR